MSTIKYQFIYIFLVSILFISCHNHDHSDHDHSGHDHGEEDAHAHEGEDHHEEEGKIKMVELNPAQMKHAEIDTGWFEMKNISDVIHANGHTRLAPQSQAEVSIAVGGTIQEINIVEGNFVKKGAILATMSSMEFNNMLLEKSKLSAEIATSQSEIEYLELDYNRQKALAEESINARKKFEKVAADLKGIKNKVSAVNAQINILDQTIQLISNSNSPMINITAPISGYITGINVHIGTLVPAGTSMFNIVDNSQMHVDLMVYEKDLSKIKKGQNVRFVFTNQSNKEVSGKIYNIGKSFENDTKSVAVHADIKGHDHSLIPDMYINALIDIGNNKVNTLPDDAIVMAEGRKFIFIWEKENTERTDHSDFARIEVKTGASQLGFTEVTLLDEIHDGDRIVTSGAYYLQSHLQKGEGGGGHHH